MKNFCILHLSDLHISNNDDPTKARLLNALIDDAIKLKEIQGLEIDSIAITGDLTDKGGSESSYKNAKEFIEKLLSKLSLDPGKLAIVPGNHDIPRREMLTPFLEKCTDSDFEEKTKCAEHWETLKSRFNNYVRFLADLGKQSSDLIFGSDILNIRTKEGNIRFYLLNTAWASYGNSDYGKLRLSRWQLEELLAESKQTNDRTLCLALAHHPLDWLTKSEKELAFEFLTDKLGINVLLHGHIHTGQIDIYSDPDKNLLNLVSGIGYPRSDERNAGQPKMNDCRYSLYNFKLDEGSVDIWLRISSGRGVFAADTLLYKAGKENGHFNLPYNTKLNINAKRQVIVNNKSISKIELDPIPIIPEYVGRKCELLELQAPNAKVAAITGVGGQGKTATASEFLRNSVQKSDPSFDVGIWADCRELPDTLHSKMIDVLCALSGGKESPELYREERLEDTARRLLKHFQEAKVLLVLDNVDAYIKADSEGVANELKPFFEIVLSSEHSSLLILTCRPPIADSRAAFVHILLPGLTENDGVELFIKRNISIRTEEDTLNCKEITKHTNGHPWWLGLIAGQIKSRRTSLQECIEQFRNGDYSTNEAIKDYFKTVWGELKPVHKRLLRYIAESARPLTQDEIAKIQNDFRINEISKELGKMQGRGLLEQHQKCVGNKTAYQVHPLIREYVHQSYPIHAQRNYVRKVLCIFMPSMMVSMLFKDDSSGFSNATSKLTPSDLIDSIETCLNSRNETQALALLEKHMETLYDQGLHHKFTSISSRVLDRINWLEANLTIKQTSVELLQETINKLELLGNSKRSNEYLSKYGNIAEEKTTSYLGYLNASAFSAWQNRDFQKSISLCCEYDSLSIKLNSRSFELHSIPNTKALAERDSGKYEAALQYFEDRIKSDGNETDYGNAARCLFYLNRLSESEHYIRKSLHSLKKPSTHTDHLNLGYAYLWIAELMEALGNINEAHCFIFLTRNTWNEYAPGLLFHLDELTRKLHLDDKPVSLEEAQKAERNFLQPR